MMCLFLLSSVVGRRSSFWWSTLFFDQDSFDMRELYSKRILIIIMVLALKLATFFALLSQSCFPLFSPTAVQ
jgi:hypothetical protein